MHPKVEFPGSLQPILEDLARPLDADLVHDGARRAIKGREVELSAGFRLNDGSPALTVPESAQLEVLCSGLRTLLAGKLGCAEADDGYPLRLHRNRPDGIPAGVWEAFRVTVTESECSVEAAEMAGLRRGIYFVENELRKRRAAILPLGEWKRWTTVEDRITRSPVAPYRWLTGWELEDENDYYPEAYLERLAQSGINGIWVAGLLRNLVSSPVIPELGPKRHKLAKLKELVGKAARYGIRVHFFCMEPRALPPGHPVARAYPEIIGVRSDIYETLCPSSPLMLDYLRQAIHDLVREVPELGGIINLCKGERPTTCWWHTEKIAHLCPRCSEGSQVELLAETLHCFADGINSAGAATNLIAWPYMPYEFDKITGETWPTVDMQALIAASPPQVRWMVNFEHGSTKEIGGQARSVQEYSLSTVQPGPFAVEIAATGKSTGHACYAKLQLGTTYELSSMPFVPVPGAVYDKIQAMKRLEMQGAMFSWIVGGFPGPMLTAAARASFEPCPDKREFLHELARGSCGEKAAQHLVRAWECFERVWQKYPFDLGVLYHGSLTRGPSYQLHLEQESRLPKVYNWGLERDRQKQFYAYVPEKWLGFLSSDEVVNTFRDMAAEWKEGVQSARQALAQETGQNSFLRRQMAVAEAIRHHFLSAANVYEFYHLRDQLRDPDKSLQKDITGRMLAIARNEIEIAESFLDLLDKDVTLGFHSELYSRCYTQDEVREKIRRTKNLCGTLAEWMESGVDEAVLNRTVEETERMRPDLWGD